MESTCGESDFILRVQVMNNVVCMCNASPFRIPGTVSVFLNTRVSSVGQDGDATYVTST
jgi:hypothetical protein